MGEAASWVHGTVVGERAGIHGTVCCRAIAQAGLRSTVDCVRVRLVVEFVLIDLCLYGCDLRSGLCISC